MPLTPWVVPDDLPAERPQPAADAWALACASASELLYQLTGRRFSGGGHLGRAVLERTDVACTPSAGRRLGLTTDVRTDHPLKVRLPHRHVSQVQVVTSRGEAIAGTLWRLESAQWLVDLTRAGWPRDGSLQVDYLYGAKPPPSGVTAAAILAHQLGLALLGETEGCKLPSRVTAVTRQGVTTSYRDAYDYLAAGNTGMYEVDLFITAHPRRVRTDVWSPELSALTLTAIPRSAP